MGFLLADALFMREAGEFVASGRFIACPLGDNTISSSSLNFGFLVVDLANWGEEDLSGSLYACC
jgi:hypothetical protein